jgi:hypothetical protein
VSKAEMSLSRFGHHICQEHVYFEDDQDDFEHLSHADSGASKTISNWPIEKIKEYVTIIFNELLESNTTINRKNSVVYEKDKIDARNKPILNVARVRRDLLYHWQN